MPERPLQDAEIDSALEALTRPDRLRAAEQRVADVAPQLQIILAEALRQGGWLEANESQVRQAVESGEAGERASAVRALLSEETRMSMLVGVAVGWELSRELDAIDDEHRPEGN